jgi:hypothetical protein
MNAARSVPALLGAALACAIVGAASPAAHADDPGGACSDAYVAAQRLRKDGHLSQAREKLVACSDAACPSFMTKDCNQWTAEVDAAMASIVVRVTDENGHATDAVRVYVDGERVTARPSDGAIPIDPGTHAVRCELGSRASEQSVTLAQGQRGQAVSFAFAPVSPPPPPPTPPARDTSSSGAAGGGRRIPVATWVLGGVAVVGLGGFIGFGLAGKSQESCAPTCTQSQVSTLRRDYAVADISLLVALAATGGALYFALTSKPASPAPAAAVSVQPIAGGALLGASATF